MTDIADLERILRDEIKTQQQINNMLRYELDLEKSRKEHYRELCVWAHKASRDVLMLKPGFRGFKNARDNALCQINHKMGTVT